MMKYLFIVFGFLPLNVFAAPMQAAVQLTLHGVLVGYDKKIASIRTSPNTVVKVPLKSLKVPPTGLITGQATIQAQVTIEEMVALNKMPSEKR
jgi:hypothetical protein